MHQGRSFVNKDIHTQQSLGVKELHYIRAEG